MRGVLVGIGVAVGRGVCVGTGVLVLMSGIRAVGGGVSEDIRVSVTVGIAVAVSVGTSDGVAVAGSTVGVAAPITGSAGVSVTSTITWGDACSSCDAVSATVVNCSARAVAVRTMYRSCCPRVSRASTWSRIPFAA
jgi:hypothetical protein